jgi:predicted outer membrane protein
MTRFIAPVLLALAGMVSQGLAQSATEAQRDTGAREQGADRTSTAQLQGGAQGQPGDKLAKHVAVCLTLGNMEEIQLGQFAQDRAQNPQVKQFAQTMVEEHQQAVQKLQQAMPHLASINLELNAQAGAAGQSTTARPGADATASTSANQRSSATGAQSGGQEEQKMVQFAREVKQECLNLATQELGRKQGTEFDKAYIGQQIVAHTNMLAELRTAQRHLQNEQLRPIIQQGTQMTEHHLAQAKQIMEQLDAGGQGQAAGQAQRPETPATPRR